MDSSTKIIREDLSLEQKRWAIIYFFVGVMTYFLSSVVDPVFGSLMILLGFLNLLIAGRGIFLINFFVLLSLGTVALISSVDPSMFVGSTVFIAILGIVLGLLEGIWGLQELRKYIKFHQ